MRNIALVVMALLAAALVAPLIVSAGGKLAKQAKELWRRK